MSLITRTNKGSNKSKVSGTTLSVAGVSIAENASIVVCLAHDPVAVSSVTWNSNSLTKVVEETNGTSVQGSIWVLHDCTSGTGSVDVTFGSAIDAKTMTVVQLIGTTAVTSGGELNHDASASDQGSSTTPSSGSSGALAFGSEYVVGMIGWEQQFGSAGSGSFTSAQIENTTGGAGDTNIGIVEYFFQQNETTSAVTLANTGASNVPWVALIVTFNQISDAVIVSQEFRSFHYSKDRSQVAQEFRSFHYTKDRAQVAQEFRTFWYVEQVVTAQPFVQII